ncbi:MAG: DUF2378 family protein [Cystobacter sp.]
MMGISTAAASTWSLSAQQELERRLGTVGYKDTTRGFLFGTALEVVKGQASREAYQRCVEAAGAGSFTAFFSYPVSTLLKLSYAAARTLAPYHGGFENAMQYLGFRAAPRFLESTTGRMLMSLVGKDPTRLIDSMPTAYKTAWDHGGCALKWLGPRAGRLSYTNALPHPYFAGSMQQVLSSAKLRGTVVGRQVSLTECTVEFAWE